MDEWENAQVIELDEEEDLSNAPVVSDDDWSGATVIGQDPAEEARSLTFKELQSNPLKMANIRAYMTDTKGTQWEGRSDEELLDVWRTHMRWMGTNELSTLKEARYIHQADDQKKATAGAAYMIWDEIAPLWENENAGEAVFDYANSILQSPSTWLGAIVGKGASIAGGAVARKAIMQTAIQAAKTGGKEAAKKVLASGAKASVLTSVGTAAATDVATGVYQDLAYQGIMKDVGVQEDHDWLSTALSGAGGIIGGGVALGPELRKGSIGVTKKMVRESRAKRASQASGFVKGRVKKSVTRLVDRLNQMKMTHDVDWAATVEAGMDQNPGIKELTENTAWFFDVNDEDSIIRIITDSGTPLDTGEGANFTEQMVDVIRNLDPKTLDEVNADLKPVLGITLGQLVEQVAAGVSAGGSILRDVRTAKDFATNMAHVTAAVRNTDKNVLDGVEAALNAPKDIPESPQYLRYAASTWRRALVSHPGTTAVNVAGWGMAATARSLAEMLHGGVLGTKGIAQAIVTGKAGNESLKKSKALFENQVWKARMLMDPYGSREAFDTLLSLAPKNVANKTLAEFFGGVAHTSPQNMYGIPDNVVTRLGEKGLDWAAYLTMIKAQDVFTKSFSGLAKLDQEVRLAYGQGLDQLVQSGEYYKITDSMWEKSLQNLLEDTFSADYTKGDNPLNIMADLVERVSNAPGLGFIFPFGKFMNNTIGFGIQYSPVGLVPVVNKLRKMGIEGYGDDLGMDVSKVVVGSSALSMILAESMKGQESGMQWNELETSTGDVVDVANLSPLSLGAVAMRIFGHTVKGEAVPPEMFGQLRDQLGAWAWTKELDGSTPIGDLMSWMSQDDVDGVDQTKNDYLSLIVEAAAGMAGATGKILSGYTRPLEPINRLTGMATGTDAAPDRRIAKPGSAAFITQMTRYTDNIFDAVMGEDINTTLRSASRPEGDIHNPNPVAGLVGQKEVMPKNYTDRLLGMVDMPAYLFDQRTGIPEYDRWINENVSKPLNARAKQLLANPSFKNAPISVKRSQAKMLLSQTRDNVKNLLREGLVGSQEVRTQDKRAIWIGKDEALRNEAKAALNITTKDRELTDQELNMLNYYLGMRQELYQYITQ